MDIRKIDWQQALPIRHHVLWPDKAITFCKVEGDELGKHYGVYINNEIVSVASIYIEKSDTEGGPMSARLRKFATLVSFQGQGIGTELISYIILQLKSLGVRVLWCDARKTAIGFYQRFGMVQQGEEFDKSGVLYFKMKVTLT